MKSGVCPAKGRLTSGCESHPGKPPEEPGSELPVSGEIRPSKRGEAKLQAVASTSSAAGRARASSAASKSSPVRDRGGRAWARLAKAAVRAMDSGAARNPSGVREAACSEGRSVNWGGPPAPEGEVDSRGSMPWYKSHAKSRAARRESERAVVPVTAETTQLGVGKGPHFGDARVE